VIRMLLADLNRVSVDAPHFDAKVRGLAQLVEHHVSEEEGQMFQEARDSDLNLVAMGGQLDAYRAALESRYELDTDGRDLEAFLSTPTVVRIATAPASASRTPRPKGKSVTSVLGGNDKARRRTKSIATSQQRRTRRSGHTRTEASEGEPT
jgi:hypothetical protein